MKDIVFKEFNIEGKPDITFRVGMIKPTEILALSMTVDLENYKKSKDLFDFALEHLEVKMGDKWNPVKTVINNKEIYMPMGIENDITSLRQLIEYFLSEVLAKAF